MLPKHYWEGRDFEALDARAAARQRRRTRSARSRPAAGAVYERVARLLGQGPAGEPSAATTSTRIRYDYYRDETVALEAFKAGDYDFRLENSAKDWATAYDVPAVRDGLAEEGASSRTTARPACRASSSTCAGRCSRTAACARRSATRFDFEWTNRTLFYGQYTRTRSYFANSELAANGVPQGAELAVLEPFRGKVPDEVFTTEYQPPATDGSGNMRDNLRKALGAAQGGRLAIDPKTKKLVNAQGQPFEFEILLVDPAFERITLPFVKNLERLGINATRAHRRHGAVQEAHATTSTSTW